MIGSASKHLVVANDNPKNRVETCLTVAEAVEIIRANKGNTSWALQVVADYDRYKHRLSPNKEAWAKVIGQQIIDRGAGHAERAKDPAEVVLGIVEFLATARADGRKFPKIHLRTADGSPVTLALAGSSSTKPGSVAVTDGGTYGSNVYYGRVETDGRYSPGRDSTQQVLELLRKFAADPAGFAAAYGRETGVCCFCNADLDDERSVLVGYGPKCADRYGLAWGSRPARNAVERGVAESTPSERSMTDRRRREEQIHQAHFDRLDQDRERQQELAGFGSDPDFRQHIRRSSELVGAGAVDAPWLAREGD